MIFIWEVRDNLNQELQREGDDTPFPQFRIPQFLSHRVIETSCCSCGMPFPDMLGASALSEALAH